jgi:hypothetical protein
MSLDSQRTEEALRHLRAIKPYDGWSHDTYMNSQGKKLVMLKRRNVPLSNTGYAAIVYDPTTECVLGISTASNDSDTSPQCRGRVLVEKNGSVARDQRDVTVNLSNNQIPHDDDRDRDHAASSAKKSTSSTKELNLKQEIQRNQQNLRRAREGQRRRENQPGASPDFSLQDFMSKLSDEDTPDLAKLGLLFIAVVTVLRIISSLKFVFNAVVFPLVVLYAMQKCPKDDTFDAKKELKRVLRGHHLPEGHQDKPADDWLSRTVARVTASVAAEAATALGHTVSYFVSYPCIMLSTQSNIWTRGFSAN